MARFEIEGTDLRLHLTAFEKLAGFHGDVAVPLRAVAAVRTVPSAWPELRGIRAPGTGLPGVVAVGTRRGRFGKDFAVVHGRGPAVVVDLSGTSFERLVVTDATAEATAESIRAGVPA